LERLVPPSLRVQDEIAAMPLISIVIPVFNEEGNVVLAYEALLAVWKKLEQR
jgi:hypothetical protein